MDKIRIYNPEGEFLTEVDAEITETNNDYQLLVPMDNPAALIEHNFLPWNMVKFDGQSFRLWFPRKWDLNKVIITLRPETKGG